MGLNSRFEQTEEGISEFQDRSIEFIQSEEQNEKRMKKSEQILRDLRATIKHSNTLLMRVPEKRKEKKGQKKYLKKTMAPNVPNLMKTLTYTSEKLD